AYARAIHIRHLFFATKREASTNEARGRTTLEQKQQTATTSLGECWQSDLAESTWTPPRPRI
ncbi:hypothetical protein, partial [Aporhodopirellula aestuarii]